MKNSHYLLMFLLVANSCYSLEKGEYECLGITLPVKSRWVPIISCVDKKLFLAACTDEAARTISVFEKKDGQWRDVGNLGKLIRKEQGNKFLQAFSVLPDQRMILWCTTTLPDRSHFYLFDKTEWSKLGPAAGYCFPRDPADPIWSYGNEFVFEVNEKVIWYFFTSGNNIKRVVVSNGKASVSKFGDALSRLNANCEFIATSSSDTTFFVRLVKNQLDLIEADEKNELAERIPIKRLSRKDLVLTKVAVSRKKSIAVHFCDEDFIGQSVMVLEPAADGKSYINKTVTSPGTIIDMKWKDGILYVLKSLPKKLVIVYLKNEKWKRKSEHVWKENDSAGHARLFFNEKGSPVAVWGAAIHQ